MSGASWAQVFRRTRAIAAKEFRQLSRDRLTFGMVVGIPLIQILIFGYSINFDVRDIGAGENPDDGVIAQAIISLGHSLRLKVIAEGVETEAQLRFLKRHGCDEVQGFLYGEPVPPADYARLLERARRKGKRA